MSVPELLLVERIVVAAVVRSGTDEAIYGVKADYATEHKLYTNNSR